MKFTYEDLVVVKETIRPHTNYGVHKVAVIYDGDYLVVFHGDIFSDSPTEVDTRFKDEYPNDPGTRSWREEFQRYQESELLSLEEAAEEYKRLTDTKTKMEQEFDVLRSQVEERMLKAAALVKEVNALVSPLDKDLCDLRDECRGLADALADGGWRQSHFRC